MLVSYARKKLERQAQNTSWDKFLVVTVDGQVCGIKYKAGKLIIGGHKKFEELMLTIIFNYEKIKDKLLIIKILC